MTDPLARVDAVAVGRRLHVPIPLRWGDLDAYNHVNNTAMLKLLEEARIRAFWRAGQSETAPSTAVLDPGGGGILTLVARQEIEYLAPVPYGRFPLDVQMWFGALGGSSIEVCYEVCSPPETAGPEGQTVYARATTVVVKVDAATGVPVRLSAEERAVWEPFLDAPLTYAHRR